MWINPGWKPAKTAIPALSLSKDDIDNELLAYKKTKLENIDELALKVAQDIAKAIVGKTLTYEEHEQLVLEALAEAKEEHII